MPHHYIRLYDSIHVHVFSSSLTKKKNSVCHCMVRGTWWNVLSADKICSMQTTPQERYPMKRKWLELKCHVEVKCAKLASVLISNILWLQRLVSRLLVVERVTFPFFPFLVLPPPPSSPLTIEWNCDVLERDTPGRGNALSHCLNCETKITVNAMTFLAPL